MINIKNSSTCFGSIELSSGQIQVQVQVLVHSESTYTIAFHIVYNCNDIISLIFRMIIPEVVFIQLSS
jgi:hypothetical protein